jgi:hypothetical protein
MNNFRKDSGTCHDPAHRPARSAFPQSPLGQDRARDVVPSHLPITCTGISMEELRFASCGIQPFSLLHYGLPYAIGSGMKPRAGSEMVFSIYPVQEDGAVGMFALLLDIQTAKGSHKCEDVVFSESKPAIFSFTTEGTRGNALVSLNIEYVGSGSANITITVTTSAPIKSDRQSGQPDPE